ncbi:uncharacterized protein LOC106012573 [Aplysia californica]|uniref:Uncharacterized protein LOC106012573 n=1 Tax=Aplysia californica TaxID=6500 RepID=A0ABM1A5S2_APLCA|nr:uncharacterized protein LOC106012573 [Aplysia californica]
MCMYVGGMHVGLFPFPASLLLPLRNKSVTFMTTDWTCSLFQQVSSSLPCSVHYRNNPILDCWQNIDEVVVALYDSGVLKQSLTFDAAGTDYLSWFSPKKLKDAGNWKDLKGLSTNYFSIPGYVRVKRNFYINHKFGGCGGDIGWLLVVDQANAKCGYEKFKTFPQFLYNSRDTRMNFKSKFRALADVMAVFVKYRSSPRAY